MTNGNTSYQELMPSVALDYFDAGRGAAIATVVSTWGSSPRPVGSQLAISGDGSFLGSVSGGCVEGAVILAAEEALVDGKCRVLEFGVTDENAFAVGLACGGEISVLVEPIGIGNGPDPELLKTIKQAHFTRDAIGYQVNLKTWQRQLVSAKDTTVADRFRRDKSGLEDDVFTAIFNPPLRMVIVGASHIAQILSTMAKASGYDTFIVDPRELFATKERFPDDVFVDKWPDKALAHIGIDPRTAVITLSHDPKIDNPALETALQQEPFYIGSLGSKRTHAKRVAYLQSKSISDASIARIHGPIGLPIGSATPAEIAISIMAEVTQALRQPEIKS